MTNYLSTLILLFSLNSIAGELVYREAIIAKVNGKIITNYELNSITHPQQKEITKTFSPEEARRKIAEVKKKALETLIDNMVILDEFKTKGFTVPPALIEKDLEDSIRYKTNGDQQEFARLLDAGSISMEEYKEQIRDSIAIELMKNENVNRKVSVTPVEISRYYQDNLAKFTTNMEVRTAIIRIGRDNKTPEVFDRAVRAVQMAIDKKEDFAMLADELSEMPGKPKGGDLGFQKVEELNDTFRNIIAELSVGQVCKPVKIGDDVYFLKLLARKGGQAKELEEVKDSIKNFLKAEQRAKYYKQYIAVLRQKASIEDFTKE